MKLQTNPFSHRFGVQVPLPLSSLICTCFPTKIILGALGEVVFDLKGPIRGFTVELDLERSAIFVFGQSLLGFFRVKLQKEKEGISLFLDRAPLEGVYLGDGRYLRRKEKLFFPFQETSYSFRAPERLFLGVTKPCNWDRVFERFSLEEMLPPLFLLSQKVPQKETLHISDLPLESFLRVHFTEMCVPRLQDDAYQGISLAPLPYRESTTIFSDLYQKVRTCFLERGKNRFSLLPTCSFVKGSIFLVEEGVGSFALRWSKARLFSAIFSAERTQELVFKVPEMPEFSLFVEKGKTYLLKGR